MIVKWHARMANLACALVGSTLGVLGIGVPASHGIIVYPWSTPIGVGWGSTAFINYDSQSLAGTTGGMGPNVVGEPTPTNVDWPVTVAFFGHATINGVKNALNAQGFTQTGGAMYNLEANAVGAQPRFWDQDSGRKNSSGGCLQGDFVHLHMRYYADPMTDYNYDSSGYGYTVIATTHHDVQEGCNFGTWYGDSEWAAYMFTQAYSAAGYGFYTDAMATYNPEPTRMDSGDSTHHWQNNGAATLIYVG